MKTAVTCDAPAKTKSATFVKGALILAIGGFIGKIFGAVYRIPLTNVLGAEGMGLYQMIFPMYSLLLTISSGGIPNALSRIVAQKCALGKNSEAGRVARNAMISLTVAGVVCAVAVAALGGVIASAQGNADARWSYYAIAPSIAFVAVIAVIRGYFQGREAMLPSAVSQIVEQVAKLVFGLVFAYFLMPYGIAAAAGGAVLGVTASEILAMAILLIQRARDKGKLPVDRTRAFRRDCAALYKFAIPVTLGGIVMPLTQLIDSAIVINILKRSMDVAGATALYGLSGGPVGSLINMPVVISLAIATAVLPSVAASHAVGDGHNTRRKAGLAVRLTVLIALPCTVMFFLFPAPMISVLYGRGLTASEITIAANLLLLSAVSVLLLALIQVATNLLHAVGRNYTPVVNLTVGAVFKVVLDVTLLPVIGIYAVAVSTLACYGVSALLDLIMLAVRVKPTFPVVRGLIAPVLATALTGGIGYGIYRLIAPYSILGALIAALFIGAVVYCLTALAVGVLTPDEMQSLPFLKKFAGFRVRGKRAPLDK